MKRERERWSHSGNYIESTGTQGTVQTKGKWEHQRKTEYLVKEEKKEREAFG